MKFLKLLSNLEIHDSLLKSIIFDFNECYLRMNVEFYDDNTCTYLTSKWHFTGVSNLNVTNINLLTGEMDIFSYEAKESDNGFHRISFQFVQGPGEPDAALEFEFREAKFH